MRYRMSRGHKSRRTFKVDTLLEKITAKQDASSIQPGFINITFLGFAEKSLENNAEIAQVEIILLKISHKKRKDSSAPSMQMSLGTADIPLNPSDPQTAPTISISTETFNPSNGPLAKSYIFLFRVKILTEMAISDGEEPVLKKQRKNGSFEALDKMYYAELTVYDKFNRCYLSDGDYEIILQDVASITKNSPKKHSSWENGNDIIESCGNINMMMTGGALLKFKLNWSKEPCAKMVERPQPYPLNENNKENIPAITNGNGSDKEKMQVVYQFVYNNNSRQQTEACEDLHCPWCSINSDQLYTLLKHLKLCHSR